MEPSSAKKKKRLPPPKQPKRSLGETLAYWREPDADNDPRHYLEREEAHRRSRFLVEWVTQACPQRDARLLELGSNVGRNLRHLHDAGFTHLSGLEINERAVALFRERSPQTAALTTLHVGAAETLLPGLSDGAYDLVFTMAVLEHVHTDSEWLFAHLARVTKAWLLTIEDERGDSWRHFPRNYQTVFETLGLRQTRHLQLDVAEHGLPPNFHARLFAHCPQASRPRTSTASGDSSSRNRT